MEQVEQALRKETNDDPEAWPRNPDPLLSFDLGSVESGRGSFGVEAVDNEGSSWDIEFTGTELSGIFPADS